MSEAKKSRGHGPARGIFFVEDEKNRGGGGDIVVYSPTKIIYIINMPLFPQLREYIYINARSCGHIYIYMPVAAGIYTYICPQLRAYIHYDIALQGGLYRFF